MNAEPHRSLSSGDAQTTRGEEARKKREALFAGPALAPYKSMKEFAPDFDWPDEDFEAFQAWCQQIRETGCY